MTKNAVQIIVRVVERPVEPSKPKPGAPYQPPKQAKFKAIATCKINGKQVSRTASMITEEETRLEAYSKLATLVAKHGSVPVQGPGVLAPTADENDDGK